MTLDSGETRARRRSRKGRSVHRQSRVPRSQSMRTIRPPSSDSGSRQRGSSIPTDSDFLRLRNFLVTSKGVINRGDSFRSKSSLSSSSSSSEAPPELPFPEVTPESYRVMVLGAPAVGKTALTRQFTTSEYICSYDSSTEEENETTVSIVLNGEEAELTFIEHGCYGEQGRGRPGAFLVVYSVTDRGSFQQAKEILNSLQHWGGADKAAVILVGNKTDLARLRVVTQEEGRSLATAQGCKYIETSAGINHQVDELLVGTLSQLRLKRRHPSKDRDCPGCKAKGLIKRILKKAYTRSKSCDNLHVL